MRTRNWKSAMTRKLVPQSKVRNWEQRMRVQRLAERFQIAAETGIRIQWQWMPECLHSDCRMRVLLRTKRSSESWPGWTQCQTERRTTQVRERPLSQSQTRIHRMPELRHSVRRDRTQQLPEQRPTQTGQSLAPGCRMRTMQWW